jgi:hypothetical protein
MRYLGFRIFTALIEPFSKYSRRKRSELFVATMSPAAGESILDIGGQPQIWDYIEAPLNITCLNLPGVMNTGYKTHHNVIFVEGDGCDMADFHENQFDMVFSNSVIEHVGDRTKIAMFAGEVQRLSNRYWIQTPYKYFPIEAHCGMPFWWLYPQAIRTLFLTRWRKKLPAWTEMVESTTVVSAGELHKLFPRGRIIYEWFFFPKSLIVYSILEPKS